MAYLLLEDPDGANSGRSGCLGRQVTDAEPPACAPIEVGKERRAGGGDGVCHCGSAVDHDHVGRLGVGGVRVGAVSAHRARSTPIRLVDYRRLSRVFEVLGKDPSTHRSSRGWITR